MLWSKSHGTAAQLLSGYVHHIDFVGNAMADSFADLAASESALDLSIISSVESCQGRTRNVQERLCAVLQRIQEFEASRKKLSESDPSLAPPPLPPLPLAALEGHDLL